MEDAGLWSGRNIQLSPLLLAVQIHVEGFDAETLKRLRAGSCATLGSATLPRLLALCLLGSTSRGTRGRLKGWRSGQGSYSFLFAFCSYHSGPASALSLAASVDFHLELISAFLEPAKGHSSSEVRVPDRCGPSPEPLQQRLNTLSSVSDFQLCRAPPLSFEVHTQALPCVLPALKVGSCCL